jgi:hypothetical protein
MRGQPCLREFSTVDADLDGIERDHHRAARPPARNRPQTTAIAMATAIGAERWASSNSSSSPNWSRSPGPALPPNHDQLRRRDLGVLGDQYRRNRSWRRPAVATGAAAAITELAAAAIPNSAPAELEVLGALTVGGPLAELT